MRHFGTMLDAPAVRYSGLDLKVARVKARVKQNRVAAAMGVSSSRVASLEREAVVTSEAARRFLQAVEECRTIGTTEAIA